MKKIVSILAVGLIGALFSTGALAQDRIRVGTTAGSDVAILEKAKEVAARDGLIVEIIEFSDYVRPNLALADKEIDLNAFQHLPYLETFCRDRGLDLVSIGLTYVAPLSFYSKKIKSFDELKEGDTITIANDPTNGGRGLMLLEKAGLIKLKEGIGLTATPFDIVENRLKLKIVAVDAAQTPRTLEDAAAAAVNNTYATDAGLQPVRDAIYREEAKGSPYANIIAVRAEDKDNPLYHKFVKAYQNKEVADFIMERYEGSSLPVFDY
ncbi:MAG: MetQ/NlpA family ABC transporter substrate-binding protein [Candidatus Adiutrix sp.]|jgi:D-methionine transport system substrate-binding protein|nr:MetQ/NlpA family ABC transporter substrate-binding protein [Candidatus Adiutrix sp.]